jgi:hypothetical protein
MDTAQVGNPLHFEWLRKLVHAILVLNLIDAVMTCIWVLSGQATEANPVMAELLPRGAVTFVAGKIALVSLGSWLLWNRRKHPMAVVGIVLLFLVYYFILLIHLSAMDLRVMEKVGWA